MEPPLSAEQLAQIERNRLAALERRRAAAAAAMAAAPQAAPPAAPAPPRVPLAALHGAPPAHPAAAHAADCRAQPRSGAAGASEAAPAAPNQAPAPAGGAPGAAVPRACARQEFDYIAVIDFESTCDEPVNHEPQEIIEFPCVLLNARTNELGAEWRVFVRPTEHPRLSAFCTRLTGITQLQVDTGMPLASALEAHTAWLEAQGLLPAAPARMAVATWSDWDLKVMLESETRWRRIQPPAHFRSWIDLKKVFRTHFPRVQGGLAEACAAAGVAWEGHAHSGLDDARNTARLAAKLIARGAVLSLTGGFAGHVPAAPRQGTLMEAFGAAATLTRTGTSGGVPRCGCGVPASIRAVRRAGPTNGRLFYSCGRYKATTGAMCDLFQWAPPGAALPADSWRGRRRRRDSRSSE